MRGSRLDLKQKILGRANAQPGAVWTAAGFFDLGGRAAIDEALQRLMSPFSRPGASSACLIGVPS